MIVILIITLAAIPVLESAKNAEQARLDLFDQFLEDFVPKLINQRPNNENGTDSKFEEYALHDQTNEDIGKLTMQMIVARSGFKYKDYLVTADDGYITQLTRIINPLADPAQLKQPPIMMMHGGIVDPTAYVWASAIQHHPEPYPRVADSGPMTSWNRSLAFMLANNGYDVWLVGTRGADSQNQHHVKYKGPKSIDHSGQQKMELKLQATFEAQKYWDFSMDEVIDFEIPRQVDKVLELTGARNVTILALSLSTMTVPPFTAGKPDYANKVHNLVLIAPIINNKGANTLIRLAHDLLTIIPDELGTFILSEFLFTRFLRGSDLLINDSRYLRYTLIKFAMTLLNGASPKYNTFLEPGVVGHLFMPMSFRFLKHYAQQVKHAKLQKYDYGYIKNQFVYGKISPPVHNISDLHVKSWLLISGSNDNLSTPKSVQQFLKEVHPKPAEHIIGPNFSHLDLIAAVKNDIHINLPILKYLDRDQLPPLASQSDQQERLQRRGTMQLDQFK